MAIPSDWIAKFSAYLTEQGFAKSTVDSYVSDVRIFYRCRNIQAGNPDFTRSDFLEYKRRLVEEGAAIATVNKKVNSLQAFNRFLVEKDARTDAVVTMKRDRIKVASGREADVDVFTEEEVSKILAYVGEPSKCSQRNRLIVYLLLYTGLRVSELCSLLLADVDRLGATLRVLGKGSKYREVPLRPELVELIQAYITGERKQSPFADWVYLLLSQRATKLHRDAARRMVGKLGHELGLEAYPHKFRHYFATKLLERGVPLTTVSKLCGHSRVDTSARYYVATSKRKKWRQ